jgi:serine/threonine protein kinase
VTLYNLVTGTLPFEADTVYSLFQTIGQGVYTIPDDIEPSLVSLIRGLLQVEKCLRFTIEQIKQHDWFRRRPPRTFDFLPFPPLALNRFQTFTMYDYLSELHQPVDEPNADGDPSMVPASHGDGANSLHHENGRDTVAVHRHRSIRRSWNCGCSRTASGDNLHQSNKRNHHRHRPRLCLVS